MALVPEIGAFEPLRQIGFAGRRFQPLARSARHPEVSGELQATARIVDLLLGREEARAQIQDGEPTPARAEQRRRRSRTFA